MKVIIGVVVALGSFIVGVLSSNRSRSKLPDNCSTPSNDIVNSIENTIGTRPKPAIPGLAPKCSWRYVDEGMMGFSNPETKTSCGVRLIGSRPIPATCPYCDKRTMNSRG